MGPRIEPLFGKLLADLDDLFFEVGRNLVGAMAGPPRSGLETCFTLGLVSGHQFMDPSPGHPVVPRHLALRTPLHHHRRNHQPPQRHSQPPRSRCALCRATGVNYVLKPDTAGPRCTRQSISGFSGLSGE